MSRRRKTVAGVCGVAALAAALCGALHVSGALRRLDLLAYDTLFLTRGTRTGDGRIVFVDIDDDSVRTFGRFPIPRGLYRELADRLSPPGSRALAVGCDVFLIERDPDPEVDRTLGEAARRHGRMFFPAVFPQPFAAGPAEMQAALSGREKAVGNAWLLLEGNPDLRDRFRADPAGARGELAALGIEPGAGDTLFFKLLDERDQENAVSRVRAMTGDDPQRTRDFLSGKLDAELVGVTPQRLEWMKARTKAVINAEILWDDKYAAHLKAGGAPGFLPFLNLTDIGYAQLVGGNPGLVAEMDPLLRARLAGRLGADRGGLGGSALAAYAGLVPGEYPVIPVLDGIGELVSVQPHLTDRDGVVRDFPLVVVQGNRAYPAMGLAAALEALGARLSDCRMEPGELVIRSADGVVLRRVPVDPLGRMRVNWNGPWGSSFRHVSMCRLIPPESHGDEARLQAARLAGELSGKLVFVGLTATGSHDLNPTPFEARYPMVGVSAHVADAILRNDFLRDAPAAAVLLLLVVAALAGALAGAGLGRLAGPLTAVGMAAGLGLGCHALFSRAGCFVPPTGAAGALGLSYVAGLFWRYLVTEREGRRVRQAFAYRTSPELVEEMMRNPAAVRLGGKRVETTVFFADLAGFTTAAEMMPPEELIHVLNAYLSEITAAVIDAGGYLDKYEGDAVMAVFGAPVERAGHAAAACRAAIEAHRRLDRLRARMEAAGQPVFRCRVGLATGGVVAGNIGSATRFDYTALGDVVNLASRLEGVNKVYGSRILVGEETATRAGPEFVFRELDLLRVKGRRGTTRILELAGLQGEIGPERRRGLDAFAEALALYRAGKFAEAGDRFAAADEALGGSDGPCETFIGRCQRFALQPPPAGWDGVYEMTGK